MAHELWYIVVITGLTGWIASTLVFIFRSFPARGQFDVLPALKWGIVIVISFIVWVVGMLNA